MSVTLNGNQLLLIIAAIGLVVIAVVPYTSNDLRAVAIGALAGLVGGHINGQMSAQRSNSKPLPG